MIAARLVEPGRFEFCTDAPRPVPGAGEILVRSRVATLCGSDYPHFTGRCGTTYPASLGFPVHETMGEVVESNAAGFQPGDPVLAIPKGDCGAKEFFVAEASRSAKPPEWRDELVLAQPLGCVLKAARRLADMRGRKAVVVGQGGIGLFWTQVLLAQGARTVIAVDLNDRRLDVARRVGAKDTINPHRDDVRAVVRELTEGQGADIVVEAVGENETQSLCLDIARQRAEVVLFGVPHQPRLDFPMMQVFRKNLTIVTSTSADAPVDFPVAFQMLLDGTVDAEAMVTHRLPFDQLNQAMAMVADGTSAQAIKILLRWP
jgi:threonine dehydrogenase-like Zn-dependent dehydrogenase